MVDRAIPRIGNFAEKVKKIWSCQKFFVTLHPIYVIGAVKVVSG